MIELIRGGTLALRCPDVHEDAVCNIAFQRTLRVPDDGETYPLPAGLGEFPLEFTERYADRAPRAWRENPGVFLPMYQSEAMWISFCSFLNDADYPFALKVGAGEINAVNGAAMSEGLSRGEQDYVVLPEQPWLDGFCVERGRVRQFTAMPLGRGYTAEEQLNGAAEHGGLRFIAYPMKRERYEELRRRELDAVALFSDSMVCASMGMAPGGRIDQDIYEDEFGVDAWDLDHAVGCTVHVANSRDYLAITGRCPPTLPTTERQYREAGIPWFKYYNTDATVLRGSPRLAALESVAEKTAQLDNGPA